jgi:hypothetical protein
VSKLLLLKTRKLFVPDLSLLDPTSILNGLTSNPLPTDKTTPPLATPTATSPVVVYTAQELINIRWQTEMERGFKTLVEGILPYIIDLREADMFIINRNSLNLNNPVI